MPDGKPAGVPCIQLDAKGLCRLFGKPERPAFCTSLQPNQEMCGDSAVHAMRFLGALEIATRPESHA